VVVRPGEKIPLDGVVISGTSSVNQAVITGESMPIEKEKGDTVYAGSINNEGFLEIKVTKKSDETMLSKITKMVEDAQKEKSRTEKFIDRFAKYYTPAVILLAILVATVPTLVFNLSFDEWFYKALILLVVSCPCALVFSTPVSMVSSITSAARNGVLIKGGNYIEEVGKARVFVFDKTGTLTKGELEVNDIISINKTPRKRILKVAASLESLSEHPIAKTIVGKAKKEKIKPDKVKRFKAIPGKGVKGIIRGKTYYIGNRRLFRELNVNFPQKKIKNLESEGKTVILLAKEKKVIGLIAVRDKIRKGAPKVIRKLKEKGVRVVMISGDNERITKAIAKQMGIEHYHAELLPQDKVKEIDNMRKKYGRVIMVGDGVNDAPALAKASVGIAMGAIGSDVAIESSDIALMKDEISKTNYLFMLSKKTLQVVKQNILASILIKGSFALLAFPGFITLWLAVAVGDMGLSLGVILNAMRLSLLKPK
jgi:Cd2+/Zn2+-exporting ATPase